MQMLPIEKGVLIAQHTHKGIDFLSNQRSIEIVRSILMELDTVATAGARRSTVYLALSAMEAIFGDILKVLEPLDAKIRTNWPKTLAGRRRKLSRLTLQEREQILERAGALPARFQPLYAPLREFRNYIHPDRELREPTPIDLSVSQAALGALNAVIEQYSPLRFIGQRKWKVIAGLAHVSSPSQIELPPNPVENLSLLVTEDPGTRFNGIMFDVVIPPGGVFDFVYHYSTKNDFRALRIDKRRGPSGGPYDSGLLMITQWRAGSIVERFVTDSEPDLGQEHHKVHARWGKTSSLSVRVDGKELRVANHPRLKFKRSRRIGLMSECASLKFFNLRIEA